MMINEIIYGECRDAMIERIPDESIDLVCTDPPYNSGRKQVKSGVEFDDKFTSTHDYIEWLKGPVFECYRVLKPTGTMYLQCDPHASHYIKVMMDAVFGEKSFRNEIIWCYSTPSPIKRDFARKHDVILRYTKGAKYTFNDAAARLPYKEPHDHIKKYDKHVATGKMTEADVASRVALGKVMEDWWPGIRPLIVSSVEFAGYPTQKPLALYKRMILISSNEGDVVLDPFCGSGTTLVAAELAGRKWVGIDSSEDAVRISQARITLAARQKRFAL